VSTTTADVRVERRAYELARFARRHGWTVGVFLLFFGLVLYWRSATALPWGTFDVQSLCIDALPLAFAAMGQAIVIMSGGIDLGVGSMMSLINVLAAKYMLDMSFRQALLFSLALIAGAALAQQKTIAIATGGTGGVYYPYGAVWRTSSARTCKG
jgi:ribose/xylose/arabinose/galactoside ABC-type transport system permease subunit